MLTAEQELIERAKNGTVYLWHEDEEDDAEIVASYLQYLGDNGIMVLQ